ncbi:cobalamin biosynthesis protein CobD [Allostella sp. ATCC 35155]|nr:cobalamin biosynthesis protein CobD [Stella sp. ATCC 35155]
MLFADPGSVAPLVHLFLALLLDAAVGDPPLLWRLLPHPVVLMGRLIAFFDRRLNRPPRSERARRFRGCVAVLAVAGAAAIVGLVLAWLATRLRVGPAIDILAIAILVAQRSLYDHVLAVAAALDRGGAEAGRAAVTHIVGRSPESLDEHGVARAAVESLAENFSDGVVAPVFWTLLFGLPGLLVYKAVNTMDSMIGHRTPQYRAFGWAAARLDDLLNLVPARLSGLLIAAAALGTPGATAGSALVTMVRDAGKHRSPNAGWPEAAMAGALGFALAGPRRYPEIIVDAPWIGAGRARLASADIERALVLYVRSCGLLIGMIGLAAFIGWLW